MASIKIYEVKIGPAKGSFADLDADSLPDPTGAGVTFTELSVIDGEFLGSLEQRGNLAAHSRFGPGDAKMSPEGVINNTGGAKFGANVGEFIDAYDGALEFTWRNRNTGGVALSGYAFEQALAASMLVDATGTLAGTTAVTLNNSSSQFEVALGDATNFVEGGVIAFTHNNVTEFTRITDITIGASAQITVSPALSHIPQIADKVRHCTTFYPTIGTTPTDVHVLVDIGAPGTAAPIRRLASGCRCEKVSLSWDGETSIMGATLKPARIFADDANADVTIAAEPPGAALQMYGSEAIVGADVTGLTPPLASARATLNLFGWSAEITFDLSASAPNTASLLRMSEMEINGASCKLTLRPEYSAVLRDMLRLEEERTFVLGMGPTGTGQGGVLIVTGSRDDGTANPAGADGDRIEMPVVIRATQFSGTTASPSTELATAPFVLAYPAG